MASFYRQTYHTKVSNDLAAKTLREKCVSGEALKMISQLEDLTEIWESLDTCFERLEKYLTEALKPILEFRKYKMIDSAAMRKFLLASEGDQKEYKNCRAPQTSHR